MERAELPTRWEDRDANFVFPCFSSAFVDRTCAPRPIHEITRMSFRRSKCIQRARTYLLGTAGLRRLNKHNLPCSAFYAHPDFGGFVDIGIDLNWEARPVLRFQKETEPRHGTVGRFNIICPPINDHPFVVAGL